MTMEEIILSLRTHHNRGELNKYLNNIANELEKHTWIDTKTESHPNEAGLYDVVLQDEQIHTAYGSYFANGWFWNFDRDLEISFNNILSKFGDRAKVAWYNKQKKSCKKVLTN